MDNPRFGTCVRPQGCASAVLSHPRPTLTGVNGQAEGSGTTPEIEVRRSARRRRTVSAYREGDKIIVLMPARLPKREQDQWVADMVERVTAREAKLRSSGSRASDEALLARARQLSKDYLDGRARPVSVRWSGNMAHRWGSCTTVDATIRLSDRLRPMPEWVIDYVLVHELAHLLVPGHGPDFWAWANRYPRTERARGYLDGVAMAAQLPSWSFSDDAEESGSASVARSASVAGSASVSGSAPDSGAVGVAEVSDSLF